MAYKSMTNFKSTWSLEVVELQLARFGYKQGQVKFNTSKINPKLVAVCTWKIWLRVCFFYYYTCDYHLLCTNCETRSSWRPRANGSLSFLLSLHLQRGVSSCLCHYESQQLRWIHDWPAKKATYRLSQWPDIRFITDESSLSSSYQS